MLGPQSETLSNLQLELLADEEPGVTAEEVEAESRRDPVQKMPPRERKPHPGRERLPESLRRVEKVILCPEQTCRSCGQETSFIGYDESEQLDVEPARYFVRVTKREKRACRGCARGTVTMAPLEPRIVEKGLASDAVVIQTTRACGGRRDRAGASAHSRPPRAAAPRGRSRSARRRLAPAQVRGERAQHEERRDGGGTERQAQRCHAEERRDERSHEARRRPSRGTAHGTCAPGTRRARGGDRGRATWTSACSRRVTPRDSMPRQVRRPGPSRRRQDRSWRPVARARGCGSRRRSPSRSPRARADRARSCGAARRCGRAAGGSRRSPAPTPPG